MKLKKISDFEWEIPTEKGMNVPGRIFASEGLLEGIREDECLEQVKNVAKLPGILKSSIVMPDAHRGYGFSIGGVAAFDLQKGVISPGGVGFDINCGLRLLATNLSVGDFMKNRKDVLHDLKRTVPSGVGRGHEKKLSEKDIDEVLVKGAEWAVEKGYGVKEDLERCEESGRMKGAEPKDVSQRAKARGKPQLGTLGAGNHFLDILEVEEIFDEKAARVFGIEKEKIVVMIHCGSRGLGHQVASDYIKLMDEKYGHPNFDRDLVNAPIKSELGQRYLSAMKGAVNFAFCNRQMIMNDVREVFERHFPGHKNSLVYDVCHNIAKMEKFRIDGKMKEVCIHRKGATRSFGPGRKEIPEVYRKIGQPVIIPGSMGTSSYLMVGTTKSEEISFGSTAHGAGRVMSRTEAKKKNSLEGVRGEMEDKDIEIEAGKASGLIEEASSVYKDIDEVIRVSDEAGIAKRVARLKPLAVMIG